MSEFIYLIFLIWHSKASPARPPHTLDYSERMTLYHNKQDWGRIVPILFWWKVLPLSFLYLPVFFLMYPTVLPSTFDIARLAQVVSSKDGIGD
jgi:hypothetical protein